jgi:hypothetical protein
MRHNQSLHININPELASDIKLHSKTLNFTCDQCEYITTSKSTLRQHRQSLHLKEHKMSIHEGQKFECECGSKFTQKSSLTVHKNAMHFEAKYPCTLCSYMGKRSDYLKHHIDTKHK